MEKLVELLNERKETQKNLATKIKCTPQAINNYIKNKSEPDIKTLIKLADYFDVSLDYLCERQWNNHIGHIPNNKKEIINLILKLNDDNTLKVMGYVNALISSQKSK